MLNAQRKRELKKKYPNGKAVGKAFIQNYLERRKADINPDFKITLASEEISYLKSTVKTQRDSELFLPYQSLQSYCAHSPVGLSITSMSITTACSEAWL